MATKSPQVMIAHLTVASSLLELRVLFSTESLLLAKKLADTNLRIEERGAALLLMQSLDRICDELTERINEYKSEETND